MLLRYELARYVVIARVSSDHVRSGLSIGVPRSCARHDAQRARIAYAYVAKIDAAAAVGGMPRVRTVGVTIV